MNKSKEKLWLLVTTRSLNFGFCLDLIQLVSYLTGRDMFDWDRKKVCFKWELIFVVKDKGINCFFPKLFIENFAKAEKKSKNAKSVSRQSCGIHFLIELSQRIKITRGGLQIL